MYDCSTHMYIHDMNNILSTDIHISTEWQSMRVCSYSKRWGFHHTWCIYSDGGKTTTGNWSSSCRWSCCWAYQSSMKLSACCYTCTPLMCSLHKTFPLSAEFKSPDLKGVKNAGVGKNLPLTDMILPIYLNFPNTLFTVQRYMYSIYLGRSQVLCWQAFRWPCIVFQCTLQNSRCFEVNYIHAHAARVCP